MRVPLDRMGAIHSFLTMGGGRVVSADYPFGAIAP
jgi:hypothetical protein